MDILPSSVSRLFAVLAVPSALAVTAAIGCVGTVEFEPLPTDPVDPVTPKGVGGGAVYGLSTSGGPSLVKVDPVTGVTTPVGALPSDITLYAGTARSALDLTHRRYSFVVSSDQVTSRLVSVDIDSGALLADVAVDRLVFDLGVDEATGKLVCKVVPLTGGGATLEIDTLDPITGELTMLSTYPAPASGAGLGGSVFSGDGSFFTIEYPTDSRALSVLDTATGTSVSHALSGPSVFDLQYDDGLDKIVALSFEGDWYKGGSDEVDVRLVTVDPSDGAVTSIKQIPGVDHVLQGSTAYDPVTKRYFFAGGPLVPQGASYWVEGNDIYTIDAENGEVLAHPEITAGPVFNMHYAP